MLWGLQWPRWAAAQGSPGQGRQGLGCGLGIGTALGKGQEEFSSRAAFQGFRLDVLLPKCRSPIPAFPGPGPAAQGKTLLFLAHTPHSLRNTSRASRLGVSVSAGQGSASLASQCSHGALGEP